MSAQTDRPAATEGPSETTRPAVSRREAVLAVATGLAALTVAVATQPAGAPEAQVRGPSLGAKLAAALGSTPRAVAVWFEGAAGRPPTNAACVDRLLLARLASLSIPELRAELRRCIVDDYSAGRIVNLKGWFLSSTEVMALTAIHGERA
jgi:hypothetical protein